MKQVLQICHDYEGPFVGVCRQYVRGFSASKVTTVFLKGKPSDQVVESVGGHDVVFLEKEGENLRGIKFAIIFRLARLLRQRHFDVVVAHRYKSIYLAGIMSYFFKLPVLIGIAHEHDVFRRITRSLFVTFWRRQFLVAGVSDSVTSNVAHYCPSLRQQNRLFTLPNALPSSFESELVAAGEARQRLGFTNSELVLGTIGRLVRKKNQSQLLEGFAAVQSANLRLVIIGDGPERSKLEAQAVALGITDRVVFKGHIQNAGQLVRGLDLFVLTSGEEEAFGVVLLEAMAARVPVLSSDAPGPKQVLGDQGFLFKRHEVADLSAKLQTFIQMPSEERAALGTRGYQRLQSQFTEAKFVDALFRLPGLTEFAEKSGVN